MGGKRRRRRVHPKARKRQKSDPPSKRTKCQRTEPSLGEQPTTTTSDTRGLVRPSEWFDRAVANDLWMPERSALQVIEKPRQNLHDRHSKANLVEVNMQHLDRLKSRQDEVYGEQPRIQDSSTVLDPLLTSWFTVTNYSSVERPTGWTTERLEHLWSDREVSAAHKSTTEASEDIQSSMELESKPPINSSIKLRIYPAPAQRQKLDQLFATHRAVYNQLVARSKDDVATRLAPSADSNKGQRMSLNEFAKKYRPISIKHSMARYFRNKRALARHLWVDSRVSGSAFRDFIRAVKSSLAAFFALIAKKKRTTFPSSNSRAYFHVLTLSRFVQWMSLSFKISRISYNSTRDILDSPRPMESLYVRGCQTSRNPSGFKDSAKVNSIL